MLSGQRPFFNVAHMANNLNNVDEFIDRGANSVEIDVQFVNGVATEIFHGFPCDWGRWCESRTEIAEFLVKVSFRSLSMLFLDIKFDGIPLGKERVAALDLMDKLMKYFWTRTNVRTNIVISIPYTDHENFVSGILTVLDEHPTLKSLVAIDVSQDTVHNVVRMYNKLNISGWIGIGITNLYEALDTFSRMDCVRTLSEFIALTWFRHDTLSNAIKERERPGSPIVKVYSWTKDWTMNMKYALELGVDGIMTNKPEVLNKLVTNATDVRKADVSDGLLVRYVQ